MLANRAGHGIAVSLHPAPDTALPFPYSAGYGIAVSLLLIIVKSVVIPIFHEAAHISIPLASPLRSYAL